MANKSEMSFEQAIARVDEIVRALEKGDTPLDESLTLFEEGTALIKRCSKQLDEAEQKVVALRRGVDGSPEEVPFDAEQ